MRRVLSLATPRPFSLQRCRHLLCVLLRGLHGCVNSEKLIPPSGRGGKEAGSEMYVSPRRGFLWRDKILFQNNGECDVRASVYVHVCGGGGMGKEQSEPVEVRLRGISHAAVRAVSCSSSPPSPSSGWTCCFACCCCSSASKLPASGTFSSAPSSASPFAPPPRVAAAALVVAAPPGPRCRAPRRWTPSPRRC